MFLRWSFAEISAMARVTYPRRNEIKQSYHRGRSSFSPEKLLNVCVRHTKISTTIHRAQFVFKKRRIYAPLIIRIANLGFSLIGEPLRLLGDAEWMRLEENRFASLYGLPLQRQHGMIRFPVLGGRALKVYLTGEIYSNELKLEAIKLAIAELARLHTLPCNGLFAHGDAHVGNVLIDFEVGGAFWFDFETQVIEGLIRTEQIAYDLVVLIFSIVQYWVSAPLETIFEEIYKQKQYNDLLVFDRLISIFVRLTHSPTIFERARFDKAIFVVEQCSLICERIRAKRTVWSDAECGHV